VFKGKPFSLSTVIAVSAASIGLILIEILRVEVVVLLEESGRCAGQLGNCTGREADFAKHCT
jgi:hypothetical protein